MGSCAGERRVTKRHAVTKALDVSLYATFDNGRTSYLAEVVMGRLIAVLALAGAAAFAAHPGSSARAHASVPSASSPVAVEVAMDAAERDFASRQAEVGFVGSAPLFGAEGLPKPLK